MSDNRCAWSREAQHRVQLTVFIGCALLDVGVAESRAVVDQRAFDPAQLLAVVSFDVEHETTIVGSTVDMFGPSGSG